jgi:hypothetical protein
MKITKYVDNYVFKLSRHKNIYKYTNVTITSSKPSRRRCGCYSINRAVMVELTFMIQDLPHNESYQLLRQTSIVSTCRTSFFICIIYHFFKNKAQYIISSHRNNCKHICERFVRTLRSSIVHFPKSVRVCMKSHT